MTENNRLLEDALEGLLYIISMMHRSLLTALRSMDMEIRPPHFMIMKKIAKEKPIPLSELGRETRISKFHMTYFTTQMVELGLIERRPAEDDRRVVNVVLTDKGRMMLQRCDSLVKDGIRKSLARLDEKDLRAQSSAVENLRGIEYKLQQSGDS